MPRDEGALNSDGVRRTPGHDAARIEESGSRSPAPGPSNDEGEALGLSEFDLHEEEEEIVRERKRQSAPVDDDDAFDVDEADDLLDLEVGEEEEYEADDEQP
jgi:hypothetical protein